MDFTLTAVEFRSVKLEFHDADTDTDILATILARMSARMSVSVSASWNASFIGAMYERRCTDWHDRQRQAERKSAARRGQDIKEEERKIDERASPNIQPNRVP